MELKAKQFEIFSGTGGVGKTTLATSRAVHLALNGKAVLLITIDPAKRLKELLGIKDEDAGKVVTINHNNDSETSCTFDSLLMDPQKTIARIAEHDDSPGLLESHVVKILTKPYGGMNEILSVVELNYQYESNKYECIVLDTPPGSHFLDFLESVNKINAFFDQSFIDIFNYLGKRVGDNHSRGKKIMTMMVSTGVKKLLGYLQKVTGDSFVDDFIEAIISIYKSKNSFLNALELQTKLKDTNLSNWFLVTSVEQGKINEALELKEHAKDLLNQKSFVILNKCLNDKLKGWVPEDETGKLLKQSLDNREQTLKKELQKSFKNILEFNEVIKVSPLEHVNELTQGWNRFVTK